MGNANSEREVDAKCRILSELLLAAARAVPPDANACTILKFACTLLSAILDPDFDPQSKAARVARLYAVRLQSGAFKAVESGKVGPVPPRDPRAQAEMDALFPTLVRLAGGAPPDAPTN